MKFYGSVPRQSSNTEPSERLRAQPSILHYKGATLTGFAPYCREEKVPEISSRFRKKESSRAPLADCSFSIPGFQLSRAGAHTLENHRGTRQPKPNPRALRPLRVPVKKSIAVQPSCCPRDSGWPTNSSALPKHTRDIDWRYSQSHCNPGKGTHWRAGSVGASGTNQHRPIFLKRWKA